MIPENRKVVVDLQPTGRRAEVSSHETLLTAAQSAGVELQSVCGGAGTCGHCKLRIVAGTLSEANSLEGEQLGSELMQAGYRLACQATALGNVIVDIPPESLTAAQRVQVEGTEAKIALDPIVVPVDWEVDPAFLPEIRDNPSRVKALLDQSGEGWSKASENDVPLLRKLDLPVRLLQELGERLTRENGKVRLAIRRDISRSTLVAVLRYRTPLLGLAVDLGTTKIAAYLVDLETGRTAAQRGAMNPQIAYGEDVISRICYASQNAECAKRLQRKVIDTLAQLIASLCEEAQASPEQIVEMVVAGNTAMHHLFAGLPVQQLGTAPYLPATTEPLHLPAGDLGLEIAPRAVVFTPPNIAGYVGGDHVAMLLGVGITERAEPSLAIDIGTNTELTLSANGRIMSCSCASGPAFEGAHIKHGMRAAPGAIERVVFDGHAVQYYTIERLPAAGICGSGILDAIATLLDAGALDERGNFRTGAARVRKNDSGGEFVLVEAAKSASGAEIVLTRQDISEIQFAKAAIRAGIEVLLQTAGLDAQALGEFVLAGAFGSYLDLRSAVRIGLFPNIPLSRFRQVGNAAGVGAKQMLVSAERRKEGEHLARRIEYIELTNHPEFHGKYVNSLLF